MSSFIKFSVNEAVRSFTRGEVTEIPSLERGEYSKFSMWISLHKSRKDSRSSINSALLGVWQVEKGGGMRPGREMPRGQACLLHNLYLQPVLERILRQTQSLNEGVMINPNSLLLRKSVSAIDSR